MVVYPLEEQGRSLVFIMKFLEHFWRNNTPIPDHMEGVQKGG